MKNAKYADLFLLPLPKKNLAAYRGVASRFGRVARRHGALAYREFAGDDLFPKGCVSFSRFAKPKRGEIVIAAVVDYKSRAHRDAVMKKVMTDPAILAMMKDKPLADMNKMAYGGFRAIVNL